MYYSFSGEEIEDLEMDNMRRDAQEDLARIKARIKAMARSVGYLCDIEDLPEDVYQAFYDEAEQAMEEEEEEDD